MSNTRELSQLASVISVSDETRNVGIGTTTPTSKLHVVGDVTATSFSGDGSSLTGVVGSGSGLIIKSNGSSVGTAGTIDFGTNLSVSFSSGTATITATGGGGSSQFVTTAAGIHTLSNVGIGTTNSTSKLTVSGDIKVSGVVTATTFIGALTGTATSTTNIPNLTGAITSNNTTTSLGSFTSLQLLTALTDETGSGANVFATSPTLVTPSLGIATATSIVVGSGVTINASGINVSGVITALGGVRGIGIFSGGNLVTTGIITALNFIGAGNTFAVNNNKIDISIAGGSQVSVGTESPAEPSSGNLWYNTNLGRTFIYYNDGDSSQWVDAAPFNIGSGSGGGASVSIGTEAPVGPTSGDLWYSTDYARIFIYYDDQITSQWVDAAPFNYAVVDGLSISGSGYVLGNLGIGTTSPSTKLHVVGDTLISGVTTSQNGFTSGIGVTNPVKIAVSGNTLTFTVVGVGSTSLRLY